MILLDPVISNSVFRIPRFFELKTISRGFALHSFTIGYFKLFFDSPESWNSGVQLQLIIVDDSEWLFHGTLSFNYHNLSSAVWPGLKGSAK